MGAWAVSGWPTRTSGEPLSTLPVQVFLAIEPAIGASSLLYPAVAVVRCAEHTRGGRVHIDGGRGRGKQERDCRQGDHWGTFPLRVQCGREPFGLRPCRPSA